MQAPVIFYADDDTDDREWLKESIEKTLQTAQVKLFNNGIEIIKGLHLCPPHEQPCLIVLDINMPGLSGRQVLEQIRNTAGWQHFKVVLFTTSSSEEDKQFALQHGAEFVSKPINFEQFKTVGKLFVDYCSAEI
jgi:CheY-like chemotaxis protein